MKFVITSLILALGLTSVTTFAQETQPVLEDSNPRLGQWTNNELARVEPEYLREGLELYWRNIAALENIRDRFAPLDDEFAARAGSILADWKAKFDDPAQAIQQESIRREADFASTLEEWEATWRAEETKHMPDFPIAEDFLERTGMAIVGDYYAGGLSALLAFTDEYQQVPHDEFDDNFWVVPDAYVIERRVVADDRGGITSNFNGTPHSPWVWIKQPMSWGPGDLESQYLTHHASSYVGNGRAELVLLAEPLSPLQYRGLDQVDSFRTTVRITRDAILDSLNPIDGPWQDAPIEVETRNDRLWGSYRIVNESLDQPGIKSCVVIDYRVAAIDGWLVYVATRYSTAFPATQELTEEDVAEVLEQSARYEPLFARMVDSVEIQTYSEARLEEELQSEQP